MHSPSRERLAGALFAAALLVACGEASVAAPDVPDAPPEREAEPAVALLDEAQGDVRFSAAGVATWTPTTRGRSLRAADAIQTNVVVRVTDDLGNSRVMTRPVLRDR